MSHQRKSLPEPAAGGAREGRARIFKPGDVCKGGRYKIFDLLGAGGMCEVWRAFDDEAVDYEKQWVAVKVLKSKLAFDEQSTRRLEKEARTLLRMKHPNLVRVHHADADEERDIFFYVMELLQGETLDTKIRRTRGMDLEEALRVVAEVGDAAHSLHLLGIIHRDLKPENIFATRDGRTVVLDLGVAKFDPARFPERATQPTGPNTILGTCAYMSPEQCFGSPLDPRSDVYALGLIAYACIAGFHAAQRGPGGWMPHDYKQWSGWHINNRPTPLPQLITWLPERVWTVISRALAKEPGDRYESADELSAELQGLSAWLKENDLLEPPAPAARFRDVAAALPLATTEEIVVASGRRALLEEASAHERAASERPSPRTAAGMERPPASAAGTVPLVEAVESDAPQSQSRASQSTSSGAHSLSSVAAAPGAMAAAAGTSQARTSARRLAAFGGGGVLLGLAIAASVVGLVGTFRHSPTPSASASVSASTGSEPVVVAPVPAMTATATAMATVSVAPSSSVTVPPAPPAKKAPPAGKMPQAPWKPAAPARGNAPPPRPTSDRIVD